MGKEGNIRGVHGPYHCNAPTGLINCRHNIAAEVVGGDVLLPIDAVQQVVAQVAQLEQLVDQFDHISFAEARLHGDCTQLSHICRRNLRLDRVMPHQSAILFDTMRSNQREYGMIALRQRQAHRRLFVLHRLERGLQLLQGQVVHCVFEY